MTPSDQSSYVMAHRYGSIDLVRYAGQRTAMMVDKKLSSYCFFQKKLNDEMSQDYLSAALKVAIEYNNIDLLNDLLDANESPLGLKVKNDATSDFFRPQNTDRLIMAAVDKGSFDVLSGCMVINTVKIFVLLALVCTKIDLWFFMLLIICLMFLENLIFLIIFFALNLRRLRNQRGLCLSRVQCFLIFLIRPIVLIIG